MVKENKPAEFSVLATAVLFVATVTLLVLAGGLLWWYWGEDLSTEWDVLRRIITACFVVWGVSLCVLVLGFIAFHLMIRDKVMGEVSSRPVKKKRRPGCRSRWTSAAISVAAIASFGEVKLACC